MARILAGIQRTSLRARLTSTAEDRHDYGRRRKRVYSRCEEKRNITWWRKKKRVVSGFVADTQREEIACPVCVCQWFAV